MTQTLVPHLGESCNLGARLKKFVTLVPHLGECCNLGARPKKFVTLVPNLGESCNLGGRSKKFVTLVPDKKMCDIVQFKSLYIGARKYDKFSTPVIIEEI